MKSIDKLGCSFPAFEIILKPADVKPEIVEVKRDASEQILDVIFGVNPFSGLPENDVALYLSDKVDPAIKDFIASQLLQPNPDIKGVIDEKSDILFDLIRQPDESQSDYAVRVRDIIESDQQYFSQAPAARQESKED